MAGEHLMRAQARYVSISAQKARLVLDMVRGMGADQALELLKVMPQTAATEVGKVMRSAIANGEENFGISREDLVVETLFADEGPTRKWRRFGARGRFKPQLRRSSHITVVLREKEGTAE